VIEEAESLEFDAARQTNVEIKARDFFVRHLVLLEQRLPAQVVV
jgi:hypothetical protein